MIIYSGLGTEDIDIALKLAHTDIYERALREEVRRKRVARDYQLVSQYFAENPLIPFGMKITPHKMAASIQGDFHTLHTGTNLSGFQ